MKRLHTILSMVLLALLTCTVTSCNDDEDDPLRNPLSSLVGDAIDATVSSLTFQWERNENATQYGYRLLDDKGEVLTGGVCTTNTQTFTNLKADTEYALEVTPFANATSKQYQNGNPIILKGRTQKILPLAAPQLAVEVTGLRVKITWEAVENAQTYYIRVLQGEEVIEEKKTTSCSYSFTGEQGETYAFEVSADTSHEAYSQSEWARIDNVLTQEEEQAEKPIWTVKGSFYDAAETQTTSTRTLEAYADGTYKLKDWMEEGSGYDLEFSVNEDGTIKILNSAGESGGYEAVYYNNEDYCYIYAAYSEFNEAEGSMYFYAYGTYADYATFEWNPEEVEVPTTQKFALGEVGELDGWGDTFLPTISDIKVELYDDYVIIRGFAGVEGYDLKVVVDNEAGNVVSVTPIINGEEGTATTSGYTPAISTGRDDYSYFMAYLADGYNMAGFDEEGGYIVMMGLFGSDSNWGQYYIEW